MPNKLTRMAREILAIEADLPFRLNYDDQFLPTVDDFELYTFVQTWGSTALGFGGVGGQAMTDATTYVFIPPVNCKQKCFVYFAGRFAYAADFSQEFMNDVQKHDMVPVSRAGKYNKPQKETDL